MRKYGKDWKRASEYIGTKSNRQIRNYAHYLKENLKKNKKLESIDLLEILNGQKIVNSKKELISQDEVKKVRKPFKRDNWSESEKAKFNKSLRTNGKDWKKASLFIGTKSIYQIRNYAVYLKQNLMKNKK